MDLFADLNKPLLELWFPLLHIWQYRQELNFNPCQIHEVWLPLLTLCHTWVFDENLKNLWPHSVFVCVPVVCVCGSIKKWPSFPALQVFKLYFIFCTVTLAGKQVKLHFHFIGGTDTILTALSLQHLRSCEPQDCACIARNARCFSHWAATLTGTISSSIYVLST